MHILMESDWVLGMTMSILSLVKFFWIFYAALLVHEAYHKVRLHTVYVSIYA